MSESTPPRASAVPAESGSIYDIGELSMRQAITPDRLLGRTNASAHFFVGGLSTVDMLIGGVLAEIFDWRVPFFVFVIPSIVFVVIGLRLKEPGRGHFEREAAGASADAIHTDEVFIEGQHPTGVYPLAYYPHNIHFLAFASTMAGRSAQAIADFEAYFRAQGLFGVPQAGELNYSRVVTLD